MHIVSLARFPGATIHCAAHRLFTPYSALCVEHSACGFHLLYSRFFFVQSPFKSFPFSATGIDAHSMSHCRASMSAPGPLLQCLEGLIVCFQRQCCELRIVNFSPGCRNTLCTVTFGNHNLTAGRASRGPASTWRVSVGLDQRCIIGRSDGRM